MRVIDLTHTIAEAMPVYPGTEPPKLTLANTYAEHGFKETHLSMFSHTGTHADAPAHLYPDRITLDAFPAAQFVGKALVIDCTELAEGACIELSRITAVQAQADAADFLLFHTGWDAHWNTPRYFGDYPVITKEVADYCLATGKKGLGFDTIGIDPIADSGLTLHHRLLSQADMMIIENLCNLGACGNGLFTFCALPLKFENADGAPLRAVAMLDA